MPDIWYNPNAPAVLGPELVTVTAGTDDMSVGGLARGRIQRFRSTAIETILRLVWPSSSGLGGRYGVEVFRAGQEMPGAIFATTWLPSRFDVAGTPGAVTDFAGGTVNLHLPVADGLDATGLRFSQPAGGNASILMGFTGAALVGRVLSLQVTAKTFGPPGARFFIWVYDGATPGVKEDMGVVAPVAPYFFPPLTTQLSGLSQALDQVFWEQARVALFNNALATGLRIQVSLDPSSLAPGESAWISELRLIAYTTAETRLAQGVAGILNSGASGIYHTVPTWQSCGLNAPSGGGNWAKAAGDEVSVLVRPLAARSLFTVPPTSQGDYRWMHIDGHDPLPLGVVTADPGSADASIDEYGRVVGLGTFSALRTHAFGLVTTAPAPSVDSQPYSAAAAGTLAVQLPYQEITTVGAITVTHIRLPVRRANHANQDQPLPTDQLLLLIERVSDGVDFGSGFLLPAQFLDPTIGRDLGDGWRLIDVPLLVPTALAAATQYRIVLASTDSGAWQCATVGVDNPTSLAVAGWSAADAATRTWGGSVDASGILAPPVRLTSAELLAVFLTEPATSTITGLDATIETQTFENLERCGGISAMPYVRLRWNVIAGPVAAGDRYQVQRRDYPDGPWWTLYMIDALTFPALAGIEDYTTTPDVTSEYRVRFVDVTNTYGAWAHVSIAVNGGPLLCFTSNERPDLNFATDDVGLGSRPRRNYVPLDGVEIAQPADAPYQTAAIDAQQRGVGFSRTVTIGDAAPKLGAYQHVEPLRRILRLGADHEEWEDVPTPIESVCVRERHGGRWYMAGRVDAVEIIPFGTMAIEVATVTVTQLAARPPVVYR